MKKLLVILIISLTLGCTTTLNSVDDFANLTIANEQIVSGQVSNTINSIELSSTEKLVVTHAINHYIAFTSRWKSRLTQLDSTTPIFTQFLAEYSELVDQYNSVESIINKNWAEYPVRYQVLLLDYQLRAKKIDSSVMDLLAAGDRYRAVINAIELARILAGIAI